ncbi:MAG: serine/threonine-protein kinase [Planctomycetota bacterium]|jgi:serine/threonine-protein kinase
MSGVPAGDEGTRPESEAIEPGSDFAGFSIIARAGGGGGGVVWRASDPRAGRTLALKLLGRIEDASPADLERIRELVDLRDSLDHPNLVPIDSLGEEGGRHFITMNWVEGVPLDELMEAGLLDRRQGLEVLEKVSRALEHAHAAGVVHRDLKPGNIIVGTDAEPRVTDFGLARVRRRRGISGRLRPARSPDSGVLVGTPCYMAPEQAEGRGAAVDARADVYSLGCILYEMLAGRRAFDGDEVMEIARKQIGERPVPPSRVREGVAADVEAVCLKCLEKDPALRYRSAGELADELRRFLDGGPVRAASPEARRERRRMVVRKTLVPAAAAVLGAAAAATALAGLAAAAVPLGTVFGGLCVWIGLRGLPEPGPRY